LLMDRSPPASVGVVFGNRNNGKVWPQRQVLH
jgi:hypothetical protein